VALVPNLNSLLEDAAKFKNGTYKKRTVDVDGADGEETEEYRSYLRNFQIFSKQLNIALTAETKAKPKDIIEATAQNTEMLRQILDVQKKRLYVEMIAVCIRYLSGKHTLTFLQNEIEPEQLQQAVAEQEESEEEEDEIMAEDGEKLRNGIACNLALRRVFGYVAHTP